MSITIMDLLNTVFNIWKMMKKGIDRLFRTNFVSLIVAS